MYFSVPELVYRASQESFVEVLTRGCRRVAQALDEAPTTCKSTATNQQFPTLLASSQDDRTSLSNNKHNVHHDFKHSEGLHCVDATDAGHRLAVPSCEPEVALPEHPSLLSGSSPSETHASADIDSEACPPPCTDMRSDGAQDHELLCSTEGSPSLSMLSSSCQILVDHQTVPSTYTTSLGSTHTPRIVVTSPPMEEPIQLLDMVMDNRVPLQSSAYLLVPPLYLSTCRMPTYTEWCACFAQPLPMISSRRSPRPVFNHSAFTSFVKRGEHERLCPFFRNILPVVTWRNFKIVALAASLSALEIRERYDTAGYVDSFERPFSWADPAEAILSQPWEQETQLIPSPCPFSVPHIMIGLAHENDSAITEANVAPQQCSSQLAVLHGLAAVLWGEHNEEHAFDTIPADDLSDDESSAPSTPTALRRVGRCLFFASSEDDGATSFETLDYSIYQQRFSDRPVSPTCDLLVGNGVKAKFFIDEDEDDGPPEYDDWFQSIAQRTQYF